MEKFLAGVLFLFIVLGVSGQDWRRSPTYHEIRLDSGFQQDPHRVSLLAGGSVNLSGIGYQGWVADAPDFTVFYDAGNDGASLTIKMESTEADTVLPVNSPSGIWHYSDDANGLNPSITFDDPISGQYQIWGGTRDDRDLARSVLLITEGD